LSEDTVAAKIIVEGVVQGVGFRDFTQRRASGLGLSGYVLNLADGRVRVHAEGPRAAVAALAQELERGPRLARVTRVAVDWSTPTGAHGRFVIRHEEPAS
jgi:acylphosphatase